MSDAPEQRSLKQCTLVPLQAPSAAPAALAAKQFFLDLALQSTVPTDLLVSRLQGDKRTKALADAYQDLAAGRQRDAGRLLAATRFEELEAFAELATQAEDTLLAELEQKLSTPAFKQGPPAPLIGKLGTKEALVAKLLRGQGVPTVSEVMASSALRDTVADQRRAVTQRAVRLRGVGELVRAQPIGVLSLERLAFTPVAYVPGDLAYSLPLLPGETVRLTHRELVRTETELIKLVTTSIETASEEEVHEATELSESSSTQRQYSTNFGASASLSGGFGPVTVSASAQFNVANSENAAHTTSLKRSREVTREASSRAKREHSVSFRVTTQREMEDTSFREIVNNTQEAVRWDFSRLLKQWRVDLYRVGMRLTFDVVVPEPGSFLLRRWVRRKQILEALDGAPLFVGLEQIQQGTVRALQAQYRVSLPPFPADETLTFRGDQTYTANVAGEDLVELSWPAGYVYAGIQSSTVQAFDGDRITGQIQAHVAENEAGLRRSVEVGSNRYLWKYFYRWDGGQSGQQIQLGLILRVTPGPGAVEAWRRECHTLVNEAARAQNDAHIQSLQRELAALENDLAYRGDPLELRQIEREELMKGALRWLLGPQFRFYSPTIPGSPLRGDSDIDLYDDPLRDHAPQTGSVIESAYRPILEYGEVVKFLHQAIEWENLISILYPYFWTDPEHWAFRQGVYHPEPTHRSFLRAGAARVVLTVRPGFESAFLGYVESLELGATLPPDHPYVAVATELRARDEVLAGPDLSDVGERAPDASWTEYTPTSALDVRRGASS